MAEEFVFNTDKAVQYMEDIRKYTLEDLESEGALSEPLVTKVREMSEYIRKMGFYMERVRSYDFTTRRYSVVVNISRPKEDMDEASYVLYAKYITNLYGVAHMKKVFAFWKLPYDANALIPQ